MRSCGKPGGAVQAQPGERHGEFPKMAVPAAFGHTTAMRVWREEVTTILNPTQAKKPSKYKNRKTIVNGITFDSKKEAMRYLALRSLESDGKIEGLQRQQKFILAPPVSLGGRKKPALSYIADFIYHKDGKMVVEDVKGFRTAAYRVKRHLMASVHNIDIKEI